MGNKFCFPGTGSAVCPVTCVIRVENVLVCNSYLSFKITAIAACVAIGSVGVLYNIDLLIAFGAYLPMLVCIAIHLFSSFVSVFVDVATVCTGLVATVGEGVLCVTDPSVAVRTACPVVNAVVIPIVA